MPINYRNLRIEIDRQSKDAIYRKVKPLMQAEFEARKQVVLDEFDAHPVTQELEAGPDASSQFIDTAHGGNLYSFLGFNAGENPTEAIRKVLQEDLRLNISQTTREVHQNTIIFKTPVRMPTLTTFHDKVGSQVPLEWTSRSFTDLLERGITGFGQYLFDTIRNFGGASRSGPAIQINKGTLRGGSAPRIKYVSEFLARFRSLIGGKNT